MSESNLIDSLIVRYEKSPAIKPLVQLLPMNLGAVIDSMLGQRYQQIVEERLQALLDEMEANMGLVEIESDYSDDYIHCFMKVVQISAGTRRHEKIRMFARLLDSVTFGTGGYQTVDEFEEYLALLDELSFRELELLMALETFQQANGITWGRAFEQAWAEFSGEMSDVLNLSLAELDMVLMRLNRTGCAETFGDKQGTNGVRYCATTPMFSKLRSLVEDFDAQSSQGSGPAADSR
ncbi:MAG: hypothetical protein AAF467_16545 [Actinomycetota bacterium]